MIDVGKISSVAPEKFLSPVQKATYETLDRLSVHYERAECDAAVTMQDCAAIEKALSVPVAKSLLLCNRRQTDFYLFVMPGDKPFVTKEFSSAMGISRVSFAPGECLGEKLGVSVGATTVFGMLADGAKQVTLVFDRAVLEREFIGLPDGTTTCYMKIRTSDLINVFLPAVHVDYKVVF
ncbi:MAG: YbaK/EbsC family protein [Candidatus Neoclostridium sp.]